MENDGFWVSMNKILAPDVGGGSLPLEIRMGGGKPQIDIQSTNLLNYPGRVRERGPPERINQNSLGARVARGPWATP